MGRFISIFLLSVFVLAMAGQAAAEPIFRVPLGAGLNFMEDNAPPVEENDTETGLSLSAAPGSWRANDAISFEFSIEGGSGQYTVTPSAPGLTYAAGWLAGTLPTGSAPTYAVSVSLDVLDESGLKGRAEIEVPVLPVLQLDSPVSSLTAYVDEPFSYVPGHTGVVGTPSWELLQGADALMAAGLSFSPSTGEISGTPTEAGSIGTLQFRVTDSFDGRSAEYSIPAGITLRSYFKTVTADVTDLDISTLFTPSEWQSNSAKTVTIEPAVTVGASSTNRAALKVQPFAGSLKIINFGRVLGAGGAGGEGISLAQAGGPAIDANGLSILITNNGSIFGGGGGGGAGGRGGDASASLPDESNWTAWIQDNGSYCNYQPNGNAQVINIYWGNGVLLHKGTRYGGFTQTFNANVGGYNYQCTAASGNVQASWVPVRRTRLVLTTLNGSEGGAGGMGQGSNNPSPVDGVEAAVPAGAAYGAAPGGVGGSGGAWGLSGAAGHAGFNGQKNHGTPGYAGGEAGASIINAHSVTVLGSGTLAGPYVE